MDTKSRSTTNATTTLDGSGVLPPLTGSIVCDSKVHATYQGVQVGADVAKFNLSGFNAHLGITAGSLWSQNSVQDGPAVISAAGLNTAFGAGTFNSTVQVPFFGAYATLNHSSGLYVEFLARGQIFQNMLNSVPLNLFNQQLGARGFSISASTGWNYTIPGTDWFVEPSAGIIVSRVSVDPLNVQGVAGGKGTQFEIPGTLYVDQIRNTIGRVGVRVGTAFAFDRLVLQPFAAVSVWHDFVGSNQSRFLTCPGCTTTNNASHVPTGGVPAVVQLDVRNQNFGTYGQYSVGISGGLSDSGWLGFARVDYRNGSRLNGVNVTGGLRYQFTPEQLAMRAMVTKGDPRPTVAAIPTWDGFYAGMYSATSIGEGRYDFGFGLRSQPRTSGFGTGGQLGYAYQAGPYVAGVEAEAGTLHASGSRACADFIGLNRSSFVLTSLFNQTCKARNDWIASVAGRAGYAWERVLLFGRAGAAFTLEIFEVKCNSADLNAFPCTGVAGGNGISGPLNPGFTTSAVRVGWTAGAGFEFRISKAWSAKAEYAYMDFGRRTRIFSDGTVASVGTSTSLVKVGMNYYFSVWPDFW